MPSPRHRARRGHLVRGQRGRSGPRDRRRQAPEPHPRRRRTSPHRRDRPGGGAGNPPAGGRPPRSEARPGPVHLFALHRRRDDREQRLRAAGPRLRSHVRQRGGTGDHRRPRPAAGSGPRRLPRAAFAGDGPPGCDPHRVRSFLPAGLRVFDGAPATGEEIRRGEVLRGHRGHPGDHHPGHGASDARPLASPHGGARLPVDGSCRGRHLPAAEVPPHRLRGAGPAHRGRGDPQTGCRFRRPAARGRGLDVRRTGRGGSRGDPRPRRGAPRRGRHPGRVDRRGSGAGRVAVETAGRRGRAGRGVAGQTRLRELGGRGRSPGAPGRLPARLRGPPGPARPALAALRALRRRLCPRTHRFPLRGSRRPGPVSRLHAGGRRDGGLPRRFDVRRARRRARPFGAAATDVLPRGTEAVRRGQAPVRPREPAQSGCAGRSRTHRLQPPDGGGNRFPPEPGGSRVRGPGAPVLRGRQVPVRHHSLRRGDVPELSGHPRREGLHAGPGQGVAGDGQRLPHHGGLAFT